MSHEREYYIAGGEDLAKALAFMEEASRGVQSYG